MAQTDIAIAKQQKPENMAPAPNIIISNGCIFMIMAYSRDSEQPVATKVTIEGLIGKGTFGHVYKARLDQSQHRVALKQVVLDPFVKIREAEVMKRIQGHSNILRLIMYSCVQMGFPKKNYMLIAMEYMPMSLLDYIYQNHERSMPLIYVRVISYQLFRGLAYLHSHRICHRDIKPENTLLDPETMQLKLGDFGSAKFLSPNEPSATYVCSRLYRAPELFANNSLYGTTVDMWSAGCVLAEILKGTPLFHSNKREQAQLLHMICMLGTAGLERAPHILAASGLKLGVPTARDAWPSLLGVWVPEDLSALLNGCLTYEPAARISPLQACAHISYDELRTMEALKIPMPNGSALPPLFNFSQHELDIEPGLYLDLLPLYFPEI